MMNPAGILSSLEGYALIAGVILAGVIIWRARAKGQTLVLRKFTLRHEPGAREEPVIEIIGRRGGVIAFILTLLGLDPQTVFTVNCSEIECRSTSLGGQVSVFVPISRVASVTAGVVKPIGYLIMAALVTIAGLLIGVEARDGAVFAIALLVAIAFCVVYFISKMVLIGVSSNAGPEILLFFRPSVLEAQPVDVRKAIQTVETIREFVAAASASAPQPSDATPQRSLFKPEQVTAAQATWRAEPTTPAGDRYRGSNNLEAKAKEELRQAVHMFNSGKHSEAIDAFNEIVSRYPFTPAADKAKEYLRMIEEHKWRRHR